MPYLWNIEDDSVIRMACDNAKKELDRKLSGRGNQRLRNVTTYALNQMWRMANFRMNVMVYHPDEQTLERFMELVEDSTVRYFTGKYYNGIDLYENKTIYTGVTAAFEELTAQYEDLVNLIHVPEPVR